MTPNDRARIWVYILISNMLAVLIGAGAAALAVRL
jgi:hypothetical protein